MRKLWIFCLVILTGLTAQCRNMPLAPVSGKTCLVLSVGGTKGVAHIGAIDALKAKGIDIDCIYGNSMGSAAYRPPITDPIL